MTRRWLGVGLISTALACVACTSVPVRESSEQAHQFEPKETIAILLQYRSGLPSAEAREHEARRVEDEIVGCLTASIQKSNPAIKVIPPEDFRRTAFPDLPLSAAPRSPEYLSLRLSHPVFLKRIEPLNLRYLIAVGAKTEQWAVKFDFDHFLSSLYILGAVMRAYWYRTSDLVAAVLDLKEVRQERLKVSLTDKGTLLWMFYPLLPIPIPPAAEPQACEGLGRDLSRLFSARQAPIR